MLIQFLFTEVPRPIVASVFEVMVAVQDIQLRSMSDYQMGVLPKGSVVRVYCNDVVCLLTDGETFIERKYLEKFEWFKPLSYEI